MTAEEQIKKLEKQVEILTRQVSFINKRFGLVPDQSELDEALDAILTSRDNSKLEQYLERGGRIATA